MFGLIECSCNGCGCNCNGKLFAVLLLTQLTAIVFVAVIALVKGNGQ